jgi:hypothetical protein
MDESILYRLVLARTFLEQARANVTRQDATSLAIAVVNLHDAFDNLCGAAATHLNLPVSESLSLLKTFDRIANAQNIPGRLKIEQLNALRNSIKHQGLHPNPIVVRQLLPELIALADEMALKLLGKTVTSVRTIDLIADDGTKDSMAMVAERIELGDYKNALEQMAFIMFRVYEVQRVMQTRLARYIAYLGGSSASPTNRAEYPSIPPIELRLDFVELGIDPKEYEAFHLIVPQVGLAPGASDTAYVMTRNRYTWHAANWTRETCDHAFDILMRLIVAQQSRTLRPQIRFDQSLDKVRFLKDSAIYKDPAAQDVAILVHEGDEFYVANLPFVDGGWQGLGSELARGQFHHAKQWILGYIDKRDVTVTAYIGSELPET